MNSVDTETIYIRSIDKRISRDEFMEMLPKPGDVYKINDSNLWKCVHNDYLSFDKIVAQGANDKYNCFVIYRDSNVPSLDFVNHIADGSYIKIHPRVFAALEHKLMSISGAAENIIRNAENMQQIFQFDEI